MSKTGKIILWIVIAVVVIGGGIWWWIASQSSTPATAPSSPDNVPTATSTPSTTTPSSTASSSYPQGDSDQSINQDMTNFNAQMNGLSSDNASVTQSMSDQPVQQAE
jgi:cytoskeletal protein RodZ